DGTADDVNIYLGNGHNNFTANGNIAGLQTVVYGGSYNEHFVLNSQDAAPRLGFLSPLELHRRPNLFRGGTLIVNGAITGTSITISGSTIDGLGAEAAQVRYDTIEFLTVNGTGGNNSFTVNGTSIPTIINGGPYHDNFTLNASAAPLTINGRSD